MWSFYTGFTVPVFGHECNVVVFSATEITKNLVNLDAVCLVILLS